MLFNSLPFLLFSSVLFFIIISSLLTPSFLDRNIFFFCIYLIESTKVSIFPILLKLLKNLSGFSINFKFME